MNKTGIVYCWSIYLSKYVMHKYPCREMQNRVDTAERVVLLQPQGQEVSDGVSDEQGNQCRVLEGHREGQVHPQRLQEDWYAQNPRFLQRQSSSWPEDRLDYARVPP